MSRSDPFMLVSDNLSGKLESLHSSLDEWQHLLVSTDTATSGEFQEKERELRSGVASARRALLELTKVLGAVEAKRADHAGVDDSELESRKATLSRLEDDVKHVEKTLESREAKDKRAKDKERADRARRAREREAEAAAATASARAHADFMGQHTTMQRDERGKQDRLLEQVESGLEVVHEKATRIRTELGEQDRMITDTHNEMSATRNNIEKATDRIQTLLKTKDNRLICLIVVLVLVLVILGVIALS